MSDTAKLKLSWQHPILRQDGKSLPENELAYSTVYWNCDGKKGSTNVNMPKNEITVGLPTSEICVYTVSATDTNGSTSPESESYTYSELAALPMPPEWGDSYPLPDENKLKLQWTIPNIRIDGSPLPPEQIDHFTVYWVCNGKGGSTTVPGAQGFINVGLSPSGLCTYYLDTVDTYGLVSEKSLAYTYYEVHEAPKAPTWVSKIATEDGYLKLEWAHPTERIDGTVLPLQEIETTTVSWICDDKNPHSELVAAPDAFYLTELPAVDDTCAYTVMTKDTYGTFSQYSEVYIHKAQPDHKLPIEDVDTTYFEGWIMVYAFLHVVLMAGLFFLALRVYRKFYDDLPEKPVDPETPTTDVTNEAK